jgi:hypothetical protein
LTIYLPGDDLASQKITEKHIMKSNNIKMTAYERVNFVGGGQKKLGFSSFQVPI